MAKPTPEMMVTGPALELVVKGRGIKRGDWIRIGKMIPEPNQDMNGSIHRVYDDGIRSWIVVWYMGKRGLIDYREIDGWYPGELK